MPVLSCGGMRYQHKWQDTPLADIPDENQQNLEKTIRRAVEVGINHIETARGYGSSERQLGMVLPKLPREKIIVQTKVGPSENPDDFVRGFEESLQRLNLSHVDLLGVHGLNDAACVDLAIRKGGCLSAARKLQQRGLVRHVGFSTHAPTDQILRAIRHEEDGGFDYVNLHWYYIMQRNWPAILEATRRDMGVFIISPSDKGGRLYDPPAKLVDLCRPLHPIVFNDLFCLAHPEVHTLSIGAARPSDFDLHLEALPLLARAREVLAPILECLEHAYASAIPADLRDPFSLPLPSWQDSPAQINIPIILWLRNLAVAFDMKAYGKMRYNLLGNGGHWFPGKKAEKLEEIDFSGVCADASLAAQLKPLLAEAHQLFGGEEVKRISES